jgi:hypothetical protein
MEEIRSFNFRELGFDQSVGTIAHYEFFAIAFIDLEVTLVGSFGRRGRDLCLIHAGLFDDFTQLDWAAVFHRLPDGVGGFVEEDFVGHLVGALVVRWGFVR